jgi:hypothetical protein
MKILLKSFDDEGNEIMAETYMVLRGETLKETMTDFIEKSYVELYEEDDETSVEEEMDDCSDEIEDPYDPNEEASHNL